MIVAVVIIALVQLGYGKVMFVRWTKCIKTDTVGCVSFKSRAHLQQELKFTVKADHWRTFRPFENIVLAR